MSHASPFEDAPEEDHPTGHVEEEEEDEEEAGEEEKEQAEDDPFADVPAPSSSSHNQGAPSLDSQPMEPEPEQETALRSAAIDHTTGAASTAQPSSERRCPHRCRPPPPLFASAYALPLSHAPPAVPCQGRPIGSPASSHIHCCSSLLISLCVPACFASLPS